MKRSNFFQNINNSAKQGNSKGSTGKTFGRVLDVILDESHPNFEERGSLRAIRGIFYSIIGASKKTEEDSKAHFAYSIDSNINLAPVPGEVVEITNYPTPSSEGYSGTTGTYYTRIANYWNSPNTNTYLDTYSFPNQDISSGGRFKESDRVNPLQPLLGDMIIQGRQGQSIRFTGTKDSKVNWKHTSDTNDPLTIIRNGQAESKDGFELISEDVNKDASSIYLTTNQQIPLKPSTTRYKTYNKQPESIENYNKKQVLINSGRLVFNTTESDILLRSTKSVGIGSKTSVNIESDEYLCVDSKKIFLGEKARTAPSSTKEPALLGNQTEQFLQSLINILEGMATDMASAVTVDGKPIPLLNKRGVQAKATLQILKSRINPSGKSKLKSNKVFIE